MTRRRFVKATAIALPSRVIARTKVFLAKQYHSQPPRSHLDLFLRKIWDTVRAETGGDFNVTVYPQNGGVPLGDPEVLTQLQAGSPEFFTLNGNILSNVQPEADIQGIPFAFTSSLQVAALNDGDYGEYLRSKLVAKNIQLLPFGGMENGFKQITSVDRPIQNVDDLRGIKMRIPNGKLFYEFYNDLGAIPKIINFNQLYNALAKRDVDGQENPLVDVEDNKFYQVCKYVGLSSHQWAGYNMLANQSFWQDLPQDIRDVVIRNTTRFVPEQRAFVQALNAKAAAVLQKQGMTLIRVDVESLRQKLSDAGFYKKWRVSCGETAWRLMEAQSGPVG
jgi:TRAP-type transport system periplasmic protein